MPSVSWSEVNLFRKCPKAHDYRYHELIQSKRPAVPLLKGKILHEMLHHYVMCKKIPTMTEDAWDVLERYEKEYKKLFKEEKEEYGDIPSECSRIFEAYIRRYKNDDLTYEHSEIFVATDIHTDMRFNGYIDKIAVDPSGRRWIIDHKFHKSIPDASQRFHELQLVLYIWAWNRWDQEHPVDGICWDYIRTSPPTVPELLKDGSLSKRKNIRCDRFTYEQEIKRHKLKKADYEDILKDLEKNDLMFFERVFMPAPSKAQLESVVEDFRTTAIMAKSLKGIAPRHMSKFNCQGCEYKAVCEAEVRGLDAKFVRKAHYQPREKYHHAEESSEE